MTRLEGGPRGRDPGPPAPDSRGLHGEKATEAVARHVDPRVEILDLHAALRRLEADDPRKGEVVMLRAGLTVEEIAEVLDISRASVERDWRYARAWLLSEIEGGTGEERTP